MHRRASSRFQSLIGIQIGWNVAAARSSPKVKIWKFQSLIGIQIGWNLKRSRKDSGLLVSIPDRDSDWLKHTDTSNLCCFANWVSIPDRDSDWLKPLDRQEALARAQFQSLIGIQIGWNEYWEIRAQIADRVSIPDRDSDWLKQIPVLKVLILLSSVSIPDRDSDWLKPLPSSELHQEALFQSLIGIQIGWNPAARGNPSLHSRFNPW